MRRILLVIFAIAVPSSVWGITLPKCPTGNSDVHTQSKLLHKIAMMGADQRETVAEFQKRKTQGKSKAEQIDYHKKFAATGILNCGGSVGTAQLSGAADIITAASRAFFGPKCQEWLSDGRCFFETVGQKVFLDMTSVRGPCPHPDGRKDWAVAKLNSPITGVTPYTIPEQDWYMTADTSVVQVSGSHRDNFRNGDHSKTVQECKIRNVFKSG